MTGGAGRTKGREVRGHSTKRVARRPVQRIAAGHDICSYPAIEVSVPVFEGAVRKVSENAASLALEAITGAGNRVTLE